MDLFKNVKVLKKYSLDLLELFNGITQNDHRIKIGKYRIIETPSKDAAKRLYTKLRTAIGGEMNEVTEMYKRIESAIEQLQIDLFKDSESPDAEV